MRGFRLGQVTAVAAALLAIVAVPGSAGRPADPAPSAVAIRSQGREREVVVRLKRPRDIARINRKYRTRTLAEADGYFRLEAPAGVNVTRLVRRLRREGRVLGADSNMSLPTAEDQIQWTTAFDGDRGRPIYAAQPAVPQVGFSEAPSLTRGAGVTVAVLDTGVSARHPELAAVLEPGWNFVDGNADADDRPGGVDSSGNGTPDEAVGHGTVVAGLVHRLAPEARLLPVKVLDADGGGTLWDAVQGIRFAVDRGARVINLSLATQESSGLLQQALQEAWSAGILIVTSAGNGNTDRRQFPAGYSFALTVASVDGENRKAGFSNYGSDVDVVAPGVDLVSTFWDGQYVAWSGTSFSAALVSGEAALIRSLRPDLRVDRVARRIEESCLNVDPWNPDYRGKLGGSRGGLIQVDEALFRAAEDD